MSDLNFFLPDDSMDLLFQNGFTAQDFIKPKLLPKTETAKAQVLWTSPSIDTVSKMILLTGLSAEHLGCLIGLSAKSVNLYAQQKSQYSIKYCNWILLCRVAIATLQSNAIPMPDSRIFTPKEHECLTRFFNESSLKFPSKADNGMYGSVLWHFVPSTEKVKSAMNYLGERGYNAPKLMVEWNLDDRSVRRKKKDLEVDFAQFVVLCKLILSVDV